MTNDKHTPASVLASAQQKYPGNADKQAGYVRGWMTTDQRLRRKS